MANVKDYRFSFRQKDGGIQIIISYKDALGKWRQKSRQGFATMKEAKAAKEELRKLAEQECGLTRDVRLMNMTLLEFTEDIFFRDHPQLTYNSQKTYRSVISGFFGKIAHMPLPKITPADILNIINARISETGVTTSMRTRIGILRSILNYAIEPYHILAVSPLPKSQRMTVKKKIQRPALSQAELDQLLANLKEKKYQYYVMANISAYAGLRIGEVLGLMWNDIDFTHLTITVNRQFGLRGKADYGLKPLKTQNSYRTVPMPAKLAAILGKWRAAFPAQMSGMVFPPRPSTYTIYNRTITEVAPGFTSHSLRHTYATNLLRNGLDIKTVSALIGDTAEMTLRIYVNYTEDMRASAADSVQKIFF